MSKARLLQDYYDKPADQMGEKEIINYLYYLLTEKRNSQTSVNTYNSGLRFLYAHKPHGVAKCADIRSICNPCTVFEIRAGSGMKGNEYANMLTNIHTELEQKNQK